MFQLYIIYMIGMRVYITIKEIFGADQTSKISFLF